MMNHSPKPTNHHPETFQIKQDGKFFSRLLSRETSAANTSSRLPYYGGAALSVPFTWESQPGTPKHAFSSTSPLPTLTPPPSSSAPVLTGPSSSPSSQCRRRKRNVSMKAVFSRLASKRSQRASPSLSLSSGSTSSLSWSSYNSSPSASRFHIHRQFVSRSGSSTHYGSSYDSEEISDEKEDGYGSPEPTLGFRERGKYSNKFGGCYSMGNVKKTFLCILGHRRGTC